ncbi:DUF4150 domain-containing protein [Mesorhizobium sp. VK25A]|uniref:DUF4150 domain-containing protein n=1 Tax=Mesorhizobium vachelliae TaxID=3072309 RepID=A0ABU5ABQ4_9HYPH|nr:MULTISPECIES: PAAR-like domain-containing protein [unclassified Mesorhizobium]MDX8533964.1 DUF4150 domain-containing protein [Mesorhizobium sp. VK25D]MDX8546565.1 DUF4150 domain-containing protein [Mesorhizobium sp. VK25A]
MTKNVFAGMWEIAAQNGMNKSIARFPDVCMSPPSPPAGPIPIPYPDTSFSNNLKSASSTVLIGGNGAALAQQSYYQESVLGDEAATRTFGANVVTHQITGKTYFQAWCMDVKFEGKNVCRHLDITTSNHASGGTTTAPLTTVETMSMADQDALLDKGICPCCKGPIHNAEQKKGNSITPQEFYKPDLTQNRKATGRPVKKDIVERAQLAITVMDKIRDEAAKAGCDAAIPEDNPDDACGRHYIIKSGKNSREEFIAQDSPLTPEEHYDTTGPYGAAGPAILTQAKKIHAAKKAGDVAIVGHKTALGAGGCPVGAGNHQGVSNECAKFEKRLATAQSDLMNFHREVHF